jgi:spermidine/putrescine transport system permease protein
VRTRSGGWLIAYTVLVLAFLLSPIVMVVLFSFNSTADSSLPIRGLTTHWYDVLFADHQLLNAAKYSAIVAIAVALLCAVIGTLAAIGIVRRGGGMGKFTVALVFLPLLVPPLLVGVSLLSFFSHFGVQLSLLTVIAGQVVITLPLVVLTVATRMAGIDVSLEEAASVLGANRWQVFRHVTFPLLRPAILSSALLVIALSLDEFLVTFFTAGTRQTLPLVIWGELRTGVTPEINAASTLLLLATSLLVVGARQLEGLRSVSRVGQLRRRLFGTVADGQPAPSKAG